MTTNSRRNTLLNSCRAGESETFVFFRGRSIVFKDKGEILLLRLAQDLENTEK